MEGLFSDSPMRKTSTGDPGRCHRTGGTGTGHRGRCRRTGMASRRAALTATKTSMLDCPIPQCIACRALPLAIHRVVIEEPNIGLPATATGHCIRGNANEEHGCAGHCLCLFTETIEEHWFELPGARHCHWLFAEMQIGIIGLIAGHCHGLCIQETQWSRLAGHCRWLSAGKQLS